MVQTVVLTPESILETHGSPVTLNTKKYVKMVENVQVGAFLGMSWEGHRTCILLGNRKLPVVAPMGIKCYDTWNSLSVALDEEGTAAVRALDDLVLVQLAERSVEFFGAQFSTDQLKTMQFYNPLAYKKPDSDLMPIISGKVGCDVPIIDSDGQVLAGPLDELVSDNTKLRVLFSIGSLYFKSPNSCKLIAKVEKIQVLEKGVANDVLEYDNDIFD